MPPQLLLCHHPHMCNPLLWVCEGGGVHQGYCSTHDKFMYHMSVISYVHYSAPCTIISHYDGKKDPCVVSRRRSRQDKHSSTGQCKVQAGTDGISWREEDHMAARDRMQSCAPFPHPTRCAHIAPVLPATSSSCQQKVLLLLLLYVQCFNNNNRDTAMFQCSAAV